MAKTVKDSDSTKEQIARAVLSLAKLSAYFLALLAYFDVMKWLLGALGLTDNTLKTAVGWSFFALLALLGWAIQTLHGDKYK